MPGPVPDQVSGHAEVSASDCKYPRLAASSGTQHFLRMMRVTPLAARELQA
jgi:hypothetical protein